MESTRRHSPVLGSTENQHPVKGILKKTIATQQQSDEIAPRLKWDEQNLIITEAQKDSTMKIDEPKTPFVYYDHELDKVMDPEEVFALDGPRKKQAALAHTPPVPSYFKGLQDEEDDEEDDEDDDKDRDRDPDEWQSSDEEEEEEHESPSVHHDKFAKMRAEHYKMKEAIKLGQHLEDDDDDDDSEDEDEGDDCKSKRTLNSVSTASKPGSNTDMRKVKDDDDEDSLDMEL